VPLRRQDDNKVIKSHSVSSVFCDQEGIPMSESMDEQVYVRVKDAAGNEFVCPIEALKGLGEVPEEVLDKCVDDATVGRYAGNIKIQK
jgi:hypothetical protein